MLISSRWFSLTFVLGLAVGSALAVEPAMPATMAEVRIEPGTSLADRVVVPFESGGPMPVDESWIARSFGDCVFINPVDGSPAQQRNQVVDGHLRVFFPRDLWGVAEGPADQGSGLLFHSRLAPHPAYRLSFLVRFEPGFDFGRSPRMQEGKLNGLGGGSLPSGGTAPDGQGFTCRFLWDDNGTPDGARLKLYVYYLEQVRRIPGKAWGDTLDLGVDVVPGRWYRLDMQVGIDAGSGIGQVAVGIDGRQVALPLACNGRQWVRPGVMVDTLLMEMNFGGSGIGYAPVRDSTLLIDEVQIVRPAAPVLAP